MQEIGIIKISWKYLTLWRSLLSVFSEHRGPHSWSQSSTLFKVCWKSVIAAASDLINPVEADGKQLFLLGSYLVSELPNFPCIEEKYCSQLMVKEIDSLESLWELCGSCLWLAVCFWRARRKIPCVPSISFTISHLVFTDKRTASEWEPFLHTTHLPWTKCFTYSYYFSNIGRC